jgi:hypothetical protein
MTYYPPVTATHPDLVWFMVRAAAEGVPVAAIARTLKVPYDRVLHCLKRARSLGAISELPQTDWPPAQAMNERRPATVQAQKPELSRSSLQPPEEVEFLCRHVFRLTNLEAGFLVVLLRTLFAEKEKLHAVIEQQRAARPLRPLQQEVTDPKMVDVMICKLRKKMAGISRDNLSRSDRFPGDPSFVIRTSWGKGYFLDQSVKDAIYRMLDHGVGDFSHEQAAPGPVAAAEGVHPGGESSTRERGRAAGLPARP